jgi:hypothetical protein
MKIFFRKKRNTNHNLKKYVDEDGAILDTKALLKKKILMFTTTFFTTWVEDENIFCVVFI